MGKNNYEKRIVFQIKEFPHLSETFIIAQIVTAIKLNYGVFILVEKLQSIESSTHSELLNKYHLLNKIKIEDYRIPKCKMLRVLKAFFLLLKHVFRLRNLLIFINVHNKFSLTWLFQFDFYWQFNKANIFHVQYGTSSKTVSLLKKSGFKPALIVTFHGHDAFFPIHGIIPNNGYYEDLFTHVTHISANTKYLANKIIDLGCPIQKMEIIPVGVNTNFFYPLQDYQNNEPILKLITVGRLDPIKGHKLAIEAMHNLRAKELNVTLTIIGEGSEMINLKKLIKKYELENVVFLLGKKSQKEVRQSLWVHDLYLFMAIPLPDGRRETQGLATLEAQACGLPVVAFDSGGVKYTVDDGRTGLLCEEYDVKCICSKIELVYNNRQLLNKMGKNAVKFVDENFSQRVINQKWKNIYNNLANVH